MTEPYFKLSWSGNEIEYLNLVKATRLNCIKSEANNTKLFREYQEHVKRKLYYSDGSIMLPDCMGQDCTWCKHLFNVMM